jgi:uncharacterized membrane protein
MKAIILVFLVVFYLLMSTCFFTIWLKFFKEDTSRSLSLQEKCLAWVTLSIATILWPVVVPIAYLELLWAKRNNRILVERRDESERDFNP